MWISKCVGIDLGTTNSVIAMMADDNKTILCPTDMNGRRNVPSAIVYDQETKGIIVGEAAVNCRGTLPEPVVSIKRHIGNINYRASTGPLTLNPVEVSAEILKELKSRMEEYLHRIPEYADYVVDRAVITTPSYFTLNARNNIVKAGELAGLKVELALQSTTAAVLYHCHKNGIDNGIFMVYDLGGGTFDVSIVRMTEGEVFVLGIAGDNYFGGDNFDDALARFLLGKLQESDEGYDLMDMDPRGDDDDRRRFERLKLSAETIKKALSSREEYFESVDGIFEDKSGAKVNLAASVTRKDFEDLIRPLIESTLEECREALKEAERQHHITLDMIDGVLLVGGSTHIPLVAEIIEENFTSPSLPAHTKMAKPLIDEPDMAVGYGAALAAASDGIRQYIEVETDNRKSVYFTVHFAPAIGYGGISNVEGSLKAEGGELPEGICAKVTRAAGGFSKEYTVNEDGTFLFEELVAEEEKEPYSCSFIMGGKEICRTVFDAAPQETALLGSAPPILETETSSTFPIPGTDEADKVIAEARSRIKLISDAGKRVVTDKRLNRLIAELQDAIDAGDAERANYMMEKIKEIQSPESTELQPPKDVFEKKVSDLENKNSTSEKGSRLLAEEIRAAASAGLRAYDNEDQTSLYNAMNTLDEIEEMLEPYGPPPPPMWLISPMWLVCTYFAQQTMDLITKYQSSTWIPAAARKDYDKYVQQDMRTCKEIISECRFHPSDKECEQYLQSIREMYPRWENAAKLLSPVISAAAPCSAGDTHYFARSATSRSVPDAAPCSAGSTYFMASRASAATDEYEPIEEKNFRATANNLSSTFRMTTNTASAGVIWNQLREDRRIDRSMVRIEEMLNYFRYKSVVPDKEKFRISCELMPAAEGKKLLYINVQGKEEVKPRQNIVLLVDVSGSMCGNTVQVEAMVETIISKLGPGDKLSLVTYSECDKVVFRGLKIRGKYDKIWALNRYRKVKIDGCTYASAGIETAYKIGKEEYIEGGNNQVILITDGDLNFGITDKGGLAELIEEKKKSGLFLSVIGTGLRNYKDDKLETLSKHGNGVYRTVNNLADVKKCVDEEYSSLVNVIAKDVKAQVEFNPEVVESYRLLGFENREISHEDFADDEVISEPFGSGGYGVALYELVLREGEKPVESGYRYAKVVTTGSSDLGTVKIRYKEPLEDTSKEIEYVISSAEDSFTDNLRLAYVVYVCAEKLRGSDKIGVNDVELARKLCGEIGGELREMNKADFHKLPEILKRTENELNVGIHSKDKFNW